MTRKNYTVENLPEEFVKELENLDVDKAYEGREVLGEFVVPDEEKLQKENKESKSKRKLLKE